MTPELERSDSDAVDGPRVIRLPSGVGTATLPDDATAGEAAAIAAAVVAHLDAEAESGSDAEETSADLACLWAVAGRLEGTTGRRPQRRADLPGDCPRGGEWAYAGRCR